MRKTYICPESLTICLAISQHLAASNPKVTVDTQGSVDAATIETKEVNTSSNAWDNEW